MEYITATRLISKPAPVWSEWETAPIVPGEKYGWNQLDQARPDSDGVRWTELDACSGSDYSGSSYTRANYEWVRENLAENPDIAFLYGDFSSYGVLVRVEPTTDEVRDLVASLANYPVINEEEMSRVEMAWADEAWDSWARHDFVKALMDKFTGQLDCEVDAAEIERIEALIEAADDRDTAESYAIDGLRQIFETAAERANQYWESENSGMYINIDRVAAAVTLDDLAPREVA